MRDDLRYACCEYLAPFAESDAESMKWKDFKSRRQWEHGKRYRWRQRDR